MSPIPAAAFHGRTFMGERLKVQFAKGARRHEVAGSHEGRPPRPRRTQFRMTITGLPNETSWQDLKDFARGSGLDVVYSETPRDGNGRGFVEFETASDLRTAVEKLDGREFKEQPVTCISDAQAEPPMRERGRSRSPMSGGRRPYMPPGDDYHRGGPPRGYSPRRENGYRDGYRDRSPAPRRDYYEDRRSGYRSPPRSARPPMDEYPLPPRGARYDDPYRRDYPPPPDPYANARAYDRPPPPRDFPPPDSRSYGRDNGYGGGGRYEEKPYRW